MKSCCSALIDALVVSEVSRDAKLGGDDVRLHARRRRAIRCAVPRAVGDRAAAAPVAFPVRLTNSRLCNSRRHGPKLHNPSRLR